jgi:hypothetical protein
MYCCALELVLLSITLTLFYLWLVPIWIWYFGYFWQHILVWWCI